MYRREIEDRFKMLAEREAAGRQQRRVPPQEQYYEEQYYPEEEYADYEPEYSRMSGGKLSFGKANKFLRQSGLISKAAAFSGNPHFATAAHLVGYGRRRPMMRGQGLIGGVVYQQRRPKSLGPIPGRVINPWVEFIKANSDTAKKQAYDYLSKQPGYYSGRDVNSLRMAILSNMYHEGTPTEDDIASYVGSELMSKQYSQIPKKQRRYFNNTPRRDYFE